MRNLPATDASNTQQVVGGPGHSVKHESAELHVSGKARYTDDLGAPADVLYAYVGLSTVAHARLLSLDLTAVRAAAGVHTVITSEDIPGHDDIGPVFPGDPLMVRAGGSVEFYGQVMFAVAATSYEAARKAARLAIADYAPLEADVRVEQGLAKNSFVRPVHTQQRGDAPSAIEQAPLRLRGEFRIGGQEQMYLEGQASLCIPQEGGGMLVYMQGHASPGIYARAFPMSRPTSCWHWSPAVSSITALQFVNCLKNPEFCWRSTVCRPTGSTPRAQRSMPARSTGIGLHSKAN